MESFQGPINPCFLGEHLAVESFEQRCSLDFSYGGFLSADCLKGEESFANFSVDDKMPFLQMLGVEPTSILPSTEPNFQLLLRLQEQKKPWKPSYFPKSDARVPTFELESCLTHASESHSPVKSETKEHQYPVSSSCQEVASTACNPEPNSPENLKDGNSGSSSMWTRNQTAPLAKQPTTREKRKRKRTKPCKNREEVESQRMTHIAVERNRRKQMNDHLNALRSLMPSSFIQRGDQASIIGGAIDFVKELEQLLQSLQAQKRKRQTDEEGHCSDSSTPFNGFFTSPQYTSYSCSPKSDVKCLIDNYINGGKFTAENKTAVADIEVTVIQTHVNLKVLCPRRPGQLLRAINALEDLCLTILHLNVTSLDPSVLYSFNLKIEEECKLSSADEIATSVYQIFSYINSN
ncbi:transcription factor bHLH67-like [Aristolochia californica]|uniref:transcription factor bHLH67-like n=1 Tax=Aristolochia californica TaxID=171875 RepID=UPI0035DE781D